MTPSAVSQQIAQLAAELGVALLRREGRRVRLTQAAYGLLEHGDASQERWEQARAEIANTSTTQDSVVRFCGVSSAIATLIAPGTPPVTDPRFEQRLVHDDPQDLLVWDGHPLQNRAGVGLADAAGEGWIVRPHDDNGRNDTYDLLLAACAAAGFTPRITHHAKEWFAVSALVAERFGVCLLPRLIPVPRDHAVVRVPLHGETLLRRKIIAAFRRGSADHPVIQAALGALGAVPVDGSVGRSPSAGPVGG